VIKHGSTVAVITL